MSNKLHARHNRDACDELLRATAYKDWVVTTAFYSSLHFVQHEIFPLVVAGQSHDTFESYYRNIPRGTRRSKHSETVKLVHDHIPNISWRYKWLHDECMSARYRKYRVKAGFDVIARTYLREIEAAMNK